MTLKHHHHNRPSSPATMASGASAGHRSPKRKPSASAANTTLLPYFIHRLTSVLPVKTSYKIHEVEEEPTFVLSKDMLKELSTKGLTNEIIPGLLALAKDTYKSDKGDIISKKSHLTLRSLVVLLNLLAEVLTAAWDSAQLQVDPNHHTAHISASLSQDFISYTVAPAPVPTGLVTNALGFLMSIKPNTTLKTGLRSISNTVSVNREAEESQEYLLLSAIDSAIEKSIRYFSASNWTETYSLVHKVFEATLSGTPNQTTDSDLIPGTELFAILFLDSSRVETVLTDFYKYSPRMKLPLHRLLIEHFLQQSLVSWAISRVPTIDNIDDHPNISKIASNLFDFIYGCSDDDRRRFSSWRFLSTLIIVVPEAFDAFEHYKPASPSLAPISSISLKPTSSLKRGNTDQPKKSAASKLKAFSNGLIGNNSSSSSISSHSSSHGNSSRGGGAYIARSSPASSSMSNSSLNPSVSSIPHSPRDKSIQKKINFLSSLSKLNNISANSPLFLALLISCTEISKAAALAVTQTPDSPLIRFAKNLYNVLLTNLFPVTSCQALNPVTSLPHLYNYQCTFISSYTVLCRDAIIKDIYPILKSDDIGMLSYVPGILQGNVNLRLMPLFHETFTSMVDIIFPLFRETLIRAVKRLNFFESQVNLDSASTTSYKICVIIILKCYFIFTLNPENFLHNYVYLKHFDDDPIFYSVVHCGISNNEDIRRTTFAFAWSFLDKENLIAYDPVEVAKSLDHQVYTLFLHLGKLSQMLMEKVTRSNMGESDIIEHLGLIKGLMEGRCLLAHQYQFAKITKHNINAIEPADIRFDISNTLETSMLILILSNNTKICKLALEVLNFMVQEAVITESPETESSSSWSIVSNFSVYSGLSSPSYIITGSMAVHKRLYQALQSAKANTPAILLAWRIIYEKWKTLTASLEQLTHIDSNMAKRWRAYSGFLASTVSAWIVEKDEPVIEGKLSKSSKIFLDQILTLLTNVHSSYLRETAREILSRDTNHSAYHFIFTTLEERLTLQLSKDHLDLHEEDFLLLEQSVSFLRAIIEYINDGEVYLAVDITSLSLSIVKKLDRLIYSERVIKLRIQYASLIACISKHKDSMNMKHDLLIRNEVAFIFANWLDYSLSIHYTNEETDSIRSSDTTRLTHEKERLHKDCIVALIDSLASITLKLTIDTPENAQGRELYEIKSHKFSVLFMLLVRVLEKCRAEEMQLHTSLILGDRLELVKNKTIECASKLLDANVDVGLKLALPLGIHEDPFIRVSFLKILDNILSHSSAQDLESEDATYEQLIDLLNENTKIVVTLGEVCPATEVDEFANALLEIFESRNNSLGLVKALVTREVERADTPMEILRRNCLATKLLSIYAHSKGISYLKKALSSFVQDLCDNPDEYTFETNPDKIPEDQTVDENIAKFEETLRKLIKALEDSLSFIPRDFRELCHTIAEAADSRYLGKNASINAISAFFFLRFVCPSLVSPEGDGLIDRPPPREVRRTLLVLAKMVQNLAYGSGSFAKLSFFKDSSVDFSEDAAAVLRIVKSLTETVPMSPKQSHGGLSPNDLLLSPVDDNASSSLTTASVSTPQPIRAVDRASLEAFHWFLYSHWEDINHKLQTELRKARQVASGHQHANNKSLLLSDPVNRANFMSARFEEDNDFRVRQKLTMLIRNLGRPKASETKKKAEAEVAINSLGVAPRLREFLERNSHRDMQPIIEKGIFHEGLSKEGMPLLIFSAQNYFRDGQDTELIVCRFFQVASKMWHQKFALFYDATGTTPENVLPLSARSVINLMIPEIMAHNCVVAYLYNVPAEMIGYLRNTFRPYQTGKYLNPLTTRYTFLTSFDIADRFNLTTLNLDTRSLRVVNDARISYDGVQRINPEKRDSIKVSLKIGNEYVQFVGQEPFTLLKGAVGMFNSVYHFSEINSIELCTTNPDEFYVSISRGGKRRIILRSTRAHEIVRALIGAKARLPKSSVAFPADSNAQLYQTLDSSIGSLLNVSFSGLCSADPAARSSAYNLLATVQARFKLNLGVSDMLRGRGLRLPANVFSQVQQYSRVVAEHYPELTHDMVSELFAAYNSTEMSRRIGILAYITPWIKHLGTHVYSLEPTKYKRGTTAGFIRRFLELSFSDAADYVYLISSIWPVILEDSITMPILIEEFLVLVMEKNLVYSTSIDDYISILTSSKSLDAVYVVKEKLFDVLQQATSVTDSNIVNCPQWNEIVLLVNILSSMLFENPEAAMTHPSEYCFIVHMLLYTGSYSFRSLLYAMMVNYVHSLITSEVITPEARSHALTIYKDLTGDKGNMIFGTSEELRNVEFSYPVTSLLFQMDSLNAMTIELARTVMPIRGLEHQHEVFMQRCLVMSTQPTSTLQSRAIVALGSSSRLDVNDSMVTVVLGVLSDALNRDNSKMREELITCVAFSISKMVNGLQADSKYYGYLFWVSIALMNTYNMEIFGHGLQLFLACLKSLDDYGVFKQMSMSQYLLSSKEEFRGEWEKLETTLDLHFSEKHFELGLAATLLRGMVKSVTRAATLSAFDTLLSISAKNQMFRERENSVVATSKIPNLALTTDVSSILSDYGSGNRSSGNKSSLGQYAHGISGSSSNLQGVFHGVSSPTFSPLGGTAASGQPGANSPNSHHIFGSRFGHRSSIAPTDLLEVDDTSTSSMPYSRGFPSYLVYLFFLYLGSRSQSDLRDYLWIAGYPEDYLEDEIPRPIRRFIGSGRTKSIVTLYLGALLYTQVEDEEKLGKRFLDVMKFVGSVNLTSYFRAYFVIRPKVKRTIDLAPGVELMRGALECAKVSLLNYEELRRPQFYLNGLDEVLLQAGLGPSKCSGGFISNTTPGFVSGNIVGATSKTSHSNSNNNSGNSSSTFTAESNSGLTGSSSSSSGNGHINLKDTGGAVQRNSSIMIKSKSSGTASSSNNLAELSHSILMNSGKSSHVSPHPITHPELTSSILTDEDLAAFIRKVAEVAHEHYCKRPGGFGSGATSHLANTCKDDDISLFQEEDEEEDDEEEEDFLKEKEEGGQYELGVGQKADSNNKEKEGLFDVGPTSTTAKSLPESTATMTTIINKSGAAARDLSPTTTASGTGELNSNGHEGNTSSVSSTSTGSNSPAGAETSSTLVTGNKLINTVTGTNEKGTAESTSATNDNHNAGGTRGSSQKAGDAHNHIGHDIDEGHEGQKGSREALPASAGPTIPPAAQLPPRSPILSPSSPSPKNTGAIVHIPGTPVTMVVGGSGSGKGVDSQDLGEPEERYYSS